MPALTSYSKSHDKDEYDHKARNSNGFYDHTPPERIKKQIGEKLWNKYFKVTAIRNPWDLVVSSYFWELNKKVSLKDYFKVVNLKALIFDYLKDFRKIRRPMNFTSYIKNLPKSYVNTNYYFDSKGKPLANYFIRYENLENDFKKVCKKIGIPAETLLSLKSKTRNSKKHYSVYYTKETRDIVAKIFEKEITYFKYKFEAK